MKKNKLIFCIYATVLGSIIGIIVWCFLRLMNFSINLIWHKVPSLIDFSFYTLVVCTIGGLLIGILKKKYGDNPEDLEKVMSDVKNTGGYSYNKFGKRFIQAMLPLIVGASVGPEAGLTGLIAGLCTWVSDKFKNLFKEMRELTQIGISATLGTIFNAPMFGFIEPIEDEEATVLPKRSKIVLYFLSIFGAFGTFILLNNIFNFSLSSMSFTKITMDLEEWLCLIPFSIIGVLVDLIYNCFHHVTDKISIKFNKYVVIKATIGGLILGVIGTILPYTMFSGEHQMKEVMLKYSEIGIVILLLTSFAKLFITNVCINFGLKGGHFFPIIFAGVCMGYAIGMLTNVDLSFSVCVITTSLVAFVLKKPLATVLLLMICFPVSAIPVMLFSATIGSVVNKDKIREV